jgi:hypothetical protein
VIAFGHDPWVELIFGLGLVAAVCVWAWLLARFASSPGDGAGAPLSGDDAGITLGAARAAARAQRKGDTT